MKRNENLTRREREKQKQREDMLAAALTLFSEKGYHNVSMQEIAGKAEFAIGTLYKFFRNKEDLYKTLMVEKVDSFQSALTAAIEDADDEIEKLRNYVRVKAALFQADAPVIRLYFAETRGASFNVRAGLDNEIRKKHEQFLKKLALVFEAGIRKQRFRKIAAPYDLAVALDSLTNTFLHLWLEAPELHPFPEDPDILLNILFQGLIEIDP
ncbi:MAG: TetR/AcrR family transcriptional regulator [Desulfobulbaceae bacterium]|nr:TetR/AcrR family transcriptional regulator [Desulfobulbaceae bacterium]